MRIPFARRVNGGRMTTEDKETQSWRGSIEPTQDVLVLVLAYMPSVNADAELFTCSGLGRKYRGIFLGSAGACISARAWMNGSAYLGFILLGRELLLNRGWGSSPRAMG
jgi:hypothetical protein